MVFALHTRPKISSSKGIDKAGNFHIFGINRTSTAHLAYYNNINGTITAQELDFKWQSSSWKRISVESDSKDKRHGF
ncbi:MAG: hypothetical protein GF329_18780 [Candidatus Lokiarchaeota archaeon]|nr:hypothetical protein [Candidatus Lokiarchaeota archaeon]